MPRWARRELGLLDLPVADRFVAAPLGRVITTAIRWAMAANPAPTAR